MSDLSAPIDQPPQTAVGGPSDGSSRRSGRFWWRAHQWVGLKLSVLMSFILFTGTLAVFANEIDWLLNPAMRVEPATARGEIAWAKIAVNATQALPGGQINELYAPIDRGFAAAAFGQAADGRYKWVYAHPVSGEVQGVGGFMTVQRVLRYMHRHLMLPNKIGIPIVSALSILLIISLATSFLVYRKWWRGFFRPIRFLDARTAIGDAHRLAGLWSIWFVALMAATGLWYLVESLGGDAPDVVWPDQAGLEWTAIDRARGVEAAITAAQIAYPALRIRSVSIASPDYGAYAVGGQGRAILVRDRANNVVISVKSHPSHPPSFWTANTVAIHRAEQLNVHQRIGEMADLLHFGTFGGVWTKIIWFVFGALLTALSLSGASIYGLRLVRQARQSPTWPRFWRHLSAGMGRWKWPATGLVLLSFILIGLAFTRF